MSANFAECFNTLPVPIADAESPLRCRYVYGYGVDGSDRLLTLAPSRIGWPLLANGTKVRGILRPCQTAKATFIASLGLEHFFDAFALEHKRDVRVDAAMALELDSEDILPNLVVTQEVAQQFKLTPVPVPVDPPAKRAEEVSLNETTVATGDVKMDRESSPESGSDSSVSNSDFSSEDGSGCVGS